MLVATNVFSPSPMPDPAASVTDSSVLGRLVAHMAWADDRVAAALAAGVWEDGTPPDAARWFAHLAGAARVWLARIEGASASPLAVWPDGLAPVDAAVHLRVAHRAFAALARDAEGLARRIVYTNSTGEAFESTVSDILTHLVQHAAHHRGQIAAAIRTGGQTPPVTDFIQFARAPDA